MTTSLNRLHATRTRLAAVALVAAGVLFFLYGAFRPWHDESTVEGATASMSSGAWVASHLFAIICYILVPLGLFGLRGVVQRTRAERVAFAAAVTSWIGAGLTIAYYGAEDFALHTIAQRSAEGPQLDLLAMVEAIRLGPAAATTFVLGLLLLGVGAVLAAVAVWRSGVLPRFSGILFAIGFAVLLPQFFLPAAARIGHGVLVGIGLAWMGIATWRAKPVDAAPAAAGVSVARGVSVAEASSAAV